MKKFLMGLTALVMALMLMLGAAVAESAPRVAALKGPTAMGMVKMMSDAPDAYGFTISAAIDEITPKLVKGEVDIAAVPANMASVLYNNTEGAVKAVPVASFVILVLLWVSSRDLSVVISLLIGFPVIYANVLAGLDSTDPRLIEMARVFRVPFRRQLGTVYLSQVAPFLRSGLGLAIGLCWKSGVAAEVIGIPSGSIGEKLYKAKIYLETPDLFCWTVAVVVLSIGCERLLTLLMDVLERRAFGCWKR